MERPEQLADAYEHVARADHYMVGIVEPVSEDERDAAKQILIARSHVAVRMNRDRVWKRIEKAIDLIERDTAAQRNGTL